MFLVNVNKLRKFTLKKHGIVTGFRGRQYMEPGMVYGIVEPTWIIENIFNGFRNDKNQR
jgi:hypothetical protein